jgi:hypothetical protein
LNEDFKTLTLSSLIDDDDAERLAGISLAKWTSKDIELVIDHKQKIWKSLFRYGDQKDSVKSGFNDLVLNVNDKNYGGVLKIFRT